MHNMSIKVRLRRRLDWNYLGGKEQNSNKGLDKRLDRSTTKAGVSSGKKVRKADGL
jgi:hypothetical protein